MFDNTGQILIAIIVVVAVFSIGMFVANAKKNDGKITSDEMFRLFMMARSLGFEVLDEVMTLKGMDGDKATTDKYVQERLTQIINDNTVLLEPEKKILLAHLPDLIDMLVKDAEKEKQRNEAKEKALDAKNETK